MLHDRILTGHHRVNGRRKKRGRKKRGRKREREREREGSVLVKEGERRGGEVVVTKRNGKTKERMKRLLYDRCTFDKFGPSYVRRIT